MPPTTAARWITMSGAAASSARATSRRSAGRSRRAGARTPSRPPASSRRTRPAEEAGAAGDHHPAALYVVRHRSDSTALDALCTPTSTALGRAARRRHLRRPRPLRVLRRHRHGAPDRSRRGRSESTSYCSPTTTRWRPSGAARRAGTGPCWCASEWRSRPAARTTSSPSGCPRRSTTAGSTPPASSPRSARPAGSGSPRTRSPGVRPVRARRPRGSRGATSTRPASPESRCGAS